MRASTPYLCMLLILLSGGVTFGRQTAGEGPPTTSAEARLESWRQHVQLHQASPFRESQWRSVGPRLQGGRIESIAVPPGNHGTIYVGPGSGNLWKTENNGLTWKPIFEHESTFTIGDIAISPSNPDIIWVGTGETPPRHSGYAYSGTGVFKSTDGGNSWRNMGLRDSHHIGRVIVDPNDPNIVYVAAIGHFWSTNRQRGVFKSSDGGESWQHVLFVSERTGSVDLVMDPSDSQTLYAAAWQLIGGPESGIYKTSDAGRSWKKVSGGLPTGELGRIGLDVADSNPSTVYAFIDNWAPGSRDREIVGGEVYRSDDKGETWRKTNEDDLYSVFGVFGWKFTDVRIAPDNENEIFILGNRVFHSTDGGKTFERIGEKIVRLFDTEGEVMHLDHHDLWIDPLNSDRVILGNDGGLFMSYDRGRTWLHINNLPIGEFYSVSVDQTSPYVIFGGTQDNAALYGPGGVTHDETRDPWKQVFLDRWTGGDAFVTLRDPLDPKIVYYEHQHGSMKRMDITGSSVQTDGPSTWDIRPRAPRGTEPGWRFGWYMPFAISKHNPSTLYAGGNVVLRSRNRGRTWRAISPNLADLAGGERAAVPFGTITMISESSLDERLIYVGTEGGSVHVTRNGGRAWSKISEGLPSKWVSGVEVSQHEAGRVYASFTGYREDDFQKYLFRSDDFGSTWTSIAGNLPAESINVIREDPTHQDILYVGTDLGVYVSLDRGRTWHSLCGNLPTTPVHDMVIQVRERDLIIATHGRSIFVLDLEPIHDRLAEER